MQVFIQKNKRSQCFLRFQNFFHVNLPVWQYMISQFPDISNSTILQNCFHPFLYAVLHGFSPATLFLCIHVPPPSVSTLAWRRAHSTSPFQGLRGRGDGGKPHFSIQQPPSLSQERTRVGHTAAHLVKDQICRAGGEGQGEEAEMQQKSWRWGGDRAGSQQHLPLQSPSWKQLPQK